jgi:hypothetical protein
LSKGVARALRAALDDKPPLLVNTAGIGIGGSFRMNPDLPKMIKAISKQTAVKRRGDASEPPARVVGAKKADSKIKVTKSPSKVDCCCLLHIYCACR